MLLSSRIDLPNNPDYEVYVRLAENPSEIEEAQRLRYKVFYLEYGAQADDETKKQERDFDSYDDITDHLIVMCAHKTTNVEKIVGTYRLLRQEIAEKHKYYYSGNEFDLSKLTQSGQKLLELGRSCVLDEYRTKPVLNLLWQGIADYISIHNIDLLFGCASFHGTDIDAIKTELSYLYHFHATPNEIAPRALDALRVDMNIISKNEIDERRTFATLPPLIKGYLRLGASIGDGAVIDEQFNTTDVCIVVQTKLMSSRYRKYYERKINKSIPGGDTPID